MNAPKKRLIIGISGATGIVYGATILRMARRAGVETHLVVSKMGQMTREYETSLSRDELDSLADHVYAPGNLAAPIASGSFQTIGMVVAPCSVRSLSEIATGVTSTLLTRAADVCLKERRKLVLLVRESPLHAGHLKSMLAVTEMGGIIAPPVPAFYLKPESIQDLVDTTCERTFDHLGIELPGAKRWEGPPSKSSPDED